MTEMDGSPRPSPCPNTYCVTRSISAEVWKAADELEDLVAMFAGITDALQTDEDGEDFCLAIWAFERRLDVLVKRIQEGNRKQ